MATSTPDFTDHQKSALVQRIITGSLSLQQACSQYGLSTDQLKEWVCLFRRAVREALDHQLRDTLSLRGLDLELWRAEFSGDLADMGVADLLQTIHMARKDARITVTHGAEASEIWCRAGRVIDAQSGRLRGDAAFYRILAIEQGSVIADFSPNERVPRIQLSTPRLLLKAAANRGMRARLMHRIGDPRQVFRAAADLTTREAARLESDELTVLRLFDGVRSVEEVLLSSGLPDARALEIVARLREQDVIVPGAGPAPSRGADSPPQSANLTTSYRPFVASAAPEPVRIPAWLLACGALSCSSLGAVTAIVYANLTALTPSSGPEAALASSAPSVASATARASSADTPLPTPTLTAVPSSAALAAPEPARRCPASMVWIEGGSFTMGSDSKRPALSLARPPHRVTLRGFCLDRHEVTAGEYRACSDAGACTPAHQTAHFADVARPGVSAAPAATGSLCNGGQPGREQHPINCVSYLQAAEYCRALGERLPTEAEWEFAARGADSRAFPWGDERPTRSRANACGKECARWQASVAAEHALGSSFAGDDGYAGTAPVGAFPRGKSPEGVADLIGNVFEWTAEGLYNYERAPSTDPRGPSDAESFVIRGGNFNSTLREFLDPALRFAMHRDSRSPGVGFRCAADAVSGEPATAPPSLAGTAEPSPTSRR